VYDVRRPRLKAARRKVSGLVAPGSRAGRALERGLEATEPTRAAGRRGAGFVVRPLRIVTRFGWITLAVAVTCWLVGRHEGWIELSMIAAGLLLAVAIGLLFTLPRVALKVSVEVQPERVVAGETMFGEFVATNLRTRRQLPVRLDLPVGRDNATFSVPSLAGGAEHTDTFRLPTRRRGVIDVGPARVVRADPLGLARRVVPLTGVKRLYVHPRTSRLEPLGAGFVRDLEGRATDHITASDLAFHALREYAPGDDLRHVHWRSSARLSSLAESATLLVRQYVDTRRSRLALVLGANRDEFTNEDEFELAVSVIGSIGLRALADGITVNLVVGAHERPALSPARLLDSLSELEIGHRGDGIVEAATVCARTIPDASVVFLVAGGEVATGRRQLAASRLGTDPRVVGIRAATDAVVSRQTLGAGSLLTLGALTDLPRLMRLEGS
jgi:uncharacterized protein (DUF58 family)